MNNFAFTKLWYFITRPYLNFSYDLIKYPPMFRACMYDCIALESHLNVNLILSRCVQGTIESIQRNALVNVSIHC